MASRARPRHFAAAAVAVGLHLIVISLAVTARWSFPQRETKVTVTELVLPRLLPPPVPQQLPPATEAQAPKFSTVVPRAPAIPQQVPAPPQSWITPSVDSRTVIEGVARSLACNLSNFDNLSADEKQRCAQRLPDGTRRVTFAFTATEDAARQEWALIIELRRILPPCPMGSANAGVGCTKAASGGLGKAISPIRGE
jgi:hypothetical protein